MFFGGKKKGDADKAEQRRPCAVLTGGQVDEIASSLIDSVCDSDTKVRVHIVAALHNVGIRQPVLVASLCVDWMNKSSKSNREHRIALLELITKLVETKREVFSQELSELCVRMAIEEMTYDKEVVPDLQTAAANVVVALASAMPELIFEELLRRFEVGTVPHYFVMKTLGDLVAANPISTVPRLKEVLARMIPILGNIKHDNMKWVMATAMYQFCEGVQTYVANIDKGCDKTLEMTTYSSEIFPAYEIMFAKWSVSSERKLRIATIRAIGFMTSIFTPSQFDQQVQKIIPAVIGMMRKEKEILFLVQGLLVILDVAVKNKSTMVDPLLTNIMTTLHPILCTQPDYNNQIALKTFNETLRCFEIIGRGFPEAVLSFVLQRLEHKDVAVRLASLGILKHLVVSINTEMENKKGLLVSGIRLIILDNNLQVKKALAQLIVAMARYNYLELEGGENLVEFIIRCCAFDELSLPSGHPDAAGNLELRDICDNILNLATTSIESMDKVLWPYLLEVVVPEKYHPAMTVICKNVAVLAAKKRASQADDYFLDFDKHINIPKPQALMAKMLVTLNLPFKRPGLGVNIMEAMRSLGPVLHPTICDMWDDKLPKLVKFLEEKAKQPDEFDFHYWEELILRLLGETVRIANDDEWSMAYAEALVAQIEIYKSEPQLRRVSLKHLGVVLQKLNHKEFIKSKLDLLFHATNHSLEIEREGCAIGFGYCSSNHLDICLEKLAEYLQQYVTSGGKGGGLFSFGKSTSNFPPVKDPVNVKNTIMLCYGNVCAYANISLITSRVEVQVFNLLKPYFTSVKIPGLREAACKCITLIAKSMSASHLQQPFVFKPRDELLKIMLDYLNAKEVELNTAVRVGCLEAISALIHLEPKLNDELEKQALGTCTKLYGLALPTEDKYAAELWEQLSGFLAALLYMNLTIEELVHLLQSLEHWCSSSVDTQREHACDSALFVLKKFIQFSTGDGAKQRVDNSFTNLGSALAMLLPRCTDPVARVRKSAIEAVGMMLYTDYLLKNAKGAAAVPPPVALRPLNSIRDRIEKPTIEEQYDAIHELARIMCDMVSEFEFPQCLIGLLYTLNDLQTTSTNGVCIILNEVIKARGTELLPTIGNVVEGFIESMEGIKDEQTLEGSLSAFRALAQHHLIPVIQQLLEQPVPHPKNVQQCIQTIAADETLAATFFEHVCNIMNNTRLHEEKSDRKRVIYIPLPLPMAATSTLGEALEATGVAALANKHYAQLYCTLLLRLGTSVNAEPKPIPQKATKDSKTPKTVTVAPVQQIVDALKAFLTLEMNAPLCESLAENNNWSKLENASTYFDAIVELAKATCEAHADKMDSIYEFMAPYLRGTYMEQRSVTAAVFSEFIRHCEKNPNLLQKLINALIGCTSDPSVKLFVLKGLGNVAANGPTEANKYASTVLDGLMACLEDSNDEFVMVSIEGLSKVFEVVDEVKVAPILVNLCHRIRPAFDKASSDEIRAASIGLLGVVCRFGASNICAERFYEQLHLNLPTLMLHLNEDKHSTQEACKATLRKMAPLFKAPEMAEFFERKAFDPDTPLPNYESLMEDLCKVLINNFADRVHFYVITFVEYFKNTSVSVRANAAEITGFLLSNISVDKRGSMNLNPALVVHALINLLKERDSPVRQKAADALSSLYNY
eukprot:TRINITY_DN4914_c0_g1_i1.p1 TRINITY_DN4914_c0_g1~~TRINITY_DN4914_c0_g1_i1.p1  ORF type:complete len:1654 (-),score=536.16 TRINITY_DN4914_c0_g1_i1:72-5033(-)